MPYNTPWSEDEKKTLARHYPAISYTKLSQAFPGRSPGAIMDMAHRLGVRKLHERMQEMGRQNMGSRWEKRRQERERGQAG
jgi:hypothetical protein